MSRLSEEQTRTIRSMLHKAGAELPCPRCGCAESPVLDGYIVEYAQPHLSNVVIGGSNRVSCVATVCSRCGYLALHMIDALRKPGYDR